MWLLWVRGSDPIQSGSLVITLTVCNKKRSPRLTIRECQTVQNGSWRAFVNYSMCSTVQGRIMLMEGTLAWNVQISRTSKSPFEFQSSSFFFRKLDVPIPQTKLVLLKAWVCNGQIYYSGINRVLVTFRLYSHHNFFKKCFISYSTNLSP